MATDLCIYLDDDPGELARLGEALGAQDVNIDGLCAFATGGGQAEIHLLVDDAAAAFDALAEAGLTVETEEEVAVVEVEDQPGVLGQYSRKLGEAGVNLHIVYMATGTRLVIGADDLAKVAKVCGAA